MDAPCKQLTMEPKTKWPWITILVIQMSLFSVSCRLCVILPEDLNMNQMYSNADAQNSITEIILGGAQIALSQHFMEVADTYFHNGVERFRPAAFKNTFFQHTLEKVSPTTHSHASGEQMKEIMAWISLAIWLNPHDIQAYLLAGFWLAEGIGKIQTAINILEQGEQNNPYSFQIQLELGRVYAMQGRLKDAEKAFETGLRIWPSGLSPDTPEAKRGIIALLVYNGLFQEINNENKEAVETYKKLLALSPDEPKVKERMEMLAKDMQPSVLASTILNDNILRSNQIIECQRPEGKKE